MIIQKILAISYGFHINISTSFIQSSNRFEVGLIHDYLLVHLSYNGYKQLFLHQPRYILSLEFTHKMQLVRLL